MVNFSFLRAAVALSWFTAFISVGCAQPEVLNIGYIQPSAQVLAFSGGLAAPIPRLHDLLLDGILAGLKMAVTDVRAENVLPDYDLRLVTAQLNNFTYSAVYDAATELIQKKVAAVVVMLVDKEFKDYLISLFWGFKIPVILSNCPLKTVADYPCFSASVDAVPIAQIFRAAPRLGINSLLFVYNPTFWDSGTIEALAAEVPSVQIRTIQSRTGTITNATLQRILESRVSTINFFGVQGARLVREAMGKDRAKHYTFLTYGRFLTADIVLDEFPVGQEAGVFDVDLITPVNEQAKFAMRAIQEGWVNGTAADMPLLNVIMVQFPYYFYYLVRMWAYGFKQLVAGQPPAMIATSFASRPVVNRQLYFSNSTINKLMGIEPRNISGVTFPFFPHKISNLNMTEFNRTRAFTATSQRFLGLIDEPGVIANGTFADGSNTPPPSVVPLPTLSFDHSSIEKTGLALGGIIILLDLIMLGLLWVFRLHKSVKSASSVFMGTTLVGSICFAVAMILSTSDMGYSECNAFPPLISVGLHLVLVSIGVKAFRLEKIFRNKNNRRIVLKDEKLAMIVVGTYIPDAILLIVWLSIAPLQPTYVEEGSWQVLQCASKTSGFAWGLFGLGVAKLAVALKYTYATRNVYLQYNEVKAVLFTCYNILSGIITGLVALALDGLGREGQMILLIIALATSSLGISTTIVGSRIYYAVMDKGGKKQHNTLNPHSFSNDREIRPGLSKSTIGAKINNITQDTTAEENAKTQAEFTVFNAAVRRQRHWFSNSPWFAGFIMIGKVDRKARPTVIISLWEDAVSGGQEARRPTQSLIMTSEQIGQVFTVADTGNTVRMECSRGIFDLDFPTDAKATQFVEVFQSQMAMVQGNDSVI
ncbi:hypothetical protein HK102_007990 [Quaeritorhiza haematococci]|nr:hypothetical protein HK102_007990 [Quaeritorhiza haematococci]